MSEPIYARTAAEWHRLLNDLEELDAVETVDDLMWLWGEER